jgi:hypothetical protein
LRLLRGPRGADDNHAAGFGKFFRAKARICKVGGHIAAVLGEHLLANLAYLFNNRIIFNHQRNSRNSIGVQMIGGSTLLSRQAFSIFPRKVAFAKWRQFHVKRNDIPIVAAIASRRHSFRRWQDGLNTSWREGNDGMPRTLRIVRPSA